MTGDPAPSDPPFLLEMRGITKSFPGVKALDGVDFTLRAGEIHALLGENGAGKSTLLGVLTGAHAADAGELQIDGCPCSIASPQEAQRRGISSVYQEVHLVPTLSVAENIFLGREPLRWGMIDWRRIRRRSAVALRRLDLELDGRQPLGELSIAAQQMVAIARALDIDARVLVLDEPTSSLDPREVERLFRVLRELRRRGLGIIFVSHVLEQVYAIADRCTVLRGGRRVGEYATAHVPRRELIACMLGQPIEEVAAKERHPAPSSRAATSSEILRAEGLGRTGSVAPLDLSIRAGEVLGFAGLLGSGRTETARLLFGIDRADSGRLLVDGIAVRAGSPRRLIDRGLGYCPENRKTEGLLLDLSVEENILVALQARRGWLRRLPPRERNIAGELIRGLGIAVPHPGISVRRLSGGNQQKVLLARWLASRPRLLILDEPTRGIDIGAKREIEGLIASLGAEGMAIVFISAELEEVVRDCHRVAVFRNRRKVSELDGEEITVAAILDALATGDEVRGHG